MKIDSVFSPQDAIIWKAKRLWAKATNPDKEAIAVEGIISTLLKIPNAVKRESYTENVAKQLNEFVSNNEYRISELQDKFDRIEEQYSEKNSEKLKKQLDELTIQLLDARSSALPKIKLSLLKSSIKDYLKKQDNLKRQKVEQAKREKNRLEAEDLGLPEGWEGDLHAALEYGIAPDMEAPFYHFKNDKGMWQQKTTFTMQVKYLIHESPQIAYRIVTMKNIYNQERTVTFNTDDLTSVGAFKKILNRYSNFSF